MRGMFFVPHVTTLARSVLRVYKIRGHPSQWYAYDITGVTLSAALTRNLRLIATYNFFFGTSERALSSVWPTHRGKDRWFILSFRVHAEFFPSWEWWYYLMKHYKPGLLRSNKNLSIKFFFSFKFYL